MVELILDGGQLGFGLEKVLDIGSKFYEKVFNFADRLKKKKFTLMISKLK